MPSEQLTSLVSGLYPGHHSDDHSNAHGSSDTPNTDTHEISKTTQSVVESQDLQMADTTQPQSENGITTSKPSTPNSPKEETKPPNPQGKPPSKVSKQTPKAPKSSARRARSNPFDPKTVLSARRSPLAKDHVHIHAILSHPKAWTSLSESQLSEVQALLPKPARAKLGSSNDDDALNDVSTMSFLMPALLGASSVFKSDCERFQEDLREGYLETAWLEKAAGAMEERMNGGFDEYKDGQFEEFWGQKAVPPDPI